MKLEFKGTKDDIEVLMGDFKVSCKINEDEDTRKTSIQIGSKELLSITEATFLPENIITEAANVAWETKLTPRQLLQQRNDLLEALQDAIERMERARRILKKDSQSNWGMLDTSDLLKAIEKALK